MKFIAQYKGLRKENYILFLGRVVTNLGAMVWPILTMILNQKMGMDATTIAIVTIIFGIIYMPMEIIGGKLADKYNKKWIIVISDSVSIIFYIICAFIPLSYFSLVLLVIAASCQTLEYPAYNALIADINVTEDRDRAYSLQYLGGNLGLVAAPTIAGFLFNDYLWLCFLLSGLSIAISTVLIALKVKNIEPEVETAAIAKYQKNAGNEKAFTILKRNPVIILFLVMSALIYAAYQQYSYLMPLDMARVNGEAGATIYGTVCTVNCFVVVIFTPLITRWLRNVTQTMRIALSFIFQLLGYVVFLILINFIPAYYVAMFIFTIGEILNTIAADPFMTARIPESHRGRINSVATVLPGIFQFGIMYAVGALYDNYGPLAGWALPLAFLVIGIGLSVILVIWDKKQYPALYIKETDCTSEGQQ